MRVQVYKDEHGKLKGWGKTGERAYNKFITSVKDLAVGEMIDWEYKIPRSRDHFNFFHVAIKELFDRQEQFLDEIHLRQWLTVGAGYADLRPGPNGVDVAIPKSIAFHSMDELEFEDLFLAVDHFTWSQRCRRYLWPHLEDEQTYEMVQAFHDQLERGRLEYKARKLREERQLASNPEGRTKNETVPVHHAHQDVEPQQVQRSAAVQANANDQDRKAGGLGDEPQGDERSPPRPAARRKPAPKGPKDDGRRQQRVKPQARA